MHGGLPSSHERSGENPCEGSEDEREYQPIAPRVVWHELHDRTGGEGMERATGPPQADRGLQLGKLHTYSSN